MSYPSIFGNLNDDILISVFDKCVSMRQQSIQNQGCNLEGIVREILKNHDIQFREQVKIDKNGTIIDYESKSNKCFHIIDFVIGNVQKCAKICDYTVLSCKTTCRERWTQDNWSRKIIPSKYILITTSNDYPTSARFEESQYRKIITLSPKRKDDRIYKLSFDHIIDELIDSETTILST